MVSTALIEPPPPRSTRWLGRGIAVGAAALLVCGGGYLAINAGASAGGADSPEAALEGVFASLTQEDLIGAAAFVEPVERETMIDAGFDVVEELVRLEVFTDELDLAAVDGVDLEFSDVEIRATEVRPGMAHLFLDGGSARATFDGAAFPFGSLVTDRIDAETRNVSESTSTSIEASDTPVVAVERDGRWYLSLWYSVAENARLALDEPLPDPADRPAAIGGDTPEQAIEQLLEAATELDMATLIGMLDPQEAAALYDYAPLFLDDAQHSADDALAEIGEEGWEWEITDLQLHSESSNGLAKVFIDGFGFDAHGPDGSLVIDYSEDAARVSFVSDETSVEVTADGDCVSTVVDEGDGVETEEFCASDIAEDMSLDALAGGVFANLRSMSVPGIVVREVDGRWFVSPLRTGSTISLDVLRVIEPAALADTIDAFMELAEDPSGLGSDFGFGFGSDEGPAFAEDCAIGGAECEVIEPMPSGPIDPAESTSSTTLPMPEISLPALTDDNAGLLTPQFEVLFVYDLVDAYRGDPWTNWLFEAEARPYDLGVVGDVLFEDESLSVIVLTGIPFASDDALANWVGGELVTDGELTYVRARTPWDSDYAIARAGDGVVVIGAWNGWDDVVVAALRAQLDG